MGHIVRCNNPKCPVSPITKYYKSKKDAIAAWNGCCRLLDIQKKGGAE